MNFLEYALGKGNQFWKYVIVLILSFVIGAGFIGIIPLLVVASVKVYQNDSIGFEHFLAYLGEMNFEGLGISSNLGLFLLMLSFVGGLLVFIGLIWLFHQRTYKETINGTRKVRWNRVWVGVIGWGVLLAITYGIKLIMNPANFVLQFDVATFIPLVLISLLFIPLQTSFEELTFRGYFAQGLAALTKSRWVAFLIPSIIFGLMHYANPEVAEFGFWIMMPQYIISGLVWGLISILDDGIELALGAHAINNVFLSLFFTHSASALQTAAVFEILEINPVRSLILLLLTSTVFVIFLYRKYNWNFSIMNKKVKKETETSDEPPPYSH